MKRDDILSKKIGLITYHAPYNFGSALQAYATQEKVHDLGYEIEILNYRMTSQKKAYSLIRTNAGTKTFLVDLSQFPVYSKKKLSAQRFEKFIASYLNLTDEFAEPENFIDLARRYDVMISGSDQIWNKESNELAFADWKYMMPYLLDGFSGKKISYASSIGHMSEEDLRYISPYLNSFDHIAMREKCSTDRISSLVDNKIETVLDPTLLLTKQEWCNKLGIKKINKVRPYILFYSLAGIRPWRRGEELLKQYALKGYQIRYITPFFSYPYFNSNFINSLSYGPLEFLKAIYNAEVVITDSFHGTVFSINMGKNFFSINGAMASDFRKTEILNKLGLMSRSITWDAKYEEMDQGEIDYKAVNEKLEGLREDSIEYLKNAIEN